MIVRRNMDESRQRVVRFLEKEINTYGALALFLAKKNIKENVRVGDKRVYLSPTYYKERVKEAKKLVSELRKTN
jgi:hypothetical protein